jgi:hypothetical protein
LYGGVFLCLRSALVTLWRLGFEGESRTGARTGQDIGVRDLDGHPKNPGKGFVRSFVWPPLAPTTAESGVPALTAGRSRMKPPTPLRTGLRILAPLLCRF